MSRCKMKVNILKAAQIEVVAQMANDYHLENHVYKILDIDIVMTTNNVHSTSGAAIIKFEESIDKGKEKKNDTK